MKKRSRQQRLASLAVLFGVGPLLAGCDVDTGRRVALRYGCERWVHRAGLRERELEAAAQPGAQEWLRVATLYGRALEGLELGRIETRADDPIEHQLAKLTTRALLGRARSMSRAGELDAARRDFETILDRAQPYAGARADAVLGLARSEDRGGRWSAALRSYREWAEGVRGGTWPLHRKAVGVPSYVSRRLGDRAQHGERRAWVELASAALEAAAVRGEHARSARYARFVLLLDAQHWEAAHAALRQTRDLHDPEGRDGVLLIAEANLLADALQRPDEALGLLSGLYGDEASYDVRYRVAASLLAAQIEAGAGNLGTAQQHYERAIAQARSAMGRAEATLGLARVHVGRGEIELARRHYTQLREGYPSTPAGLLAPLEEYGMLRERGMSAEAAALLGEAVDHYRRVIGRYGTELPALRAAGYLSECLGLSGSWERGVAFLDSVARAFATDPRSGSLLVRAARLAADQLDDTERATFLLRRVRERYPASDLAVAVRALEDSLQRARPAP